MKLVEVDLIGVLLALSLLIVPAGFTLASGQDAPVAQAPALAGSGLDPTPQPAWLVKVNAAVNDTTDLAFTADGNDADADPDPSGDRVVAPRDAPPGQRCVSAPAPAVGRPDPRVED